ncbi:hypothetical protein VIGAN_04247600 [Vigna angularis var. angularis]|uniref:Uncharacterized protein n=1 Tax=Vigna angularis var. angularis TaxID=157739 RepID=A0A0S3RWQ0_PHAAN|nr:hypothetical protein VIGAN_04247600 [Vigna angularis var. angularis]
MKHVIWRMHQMISLRAIEKICLCQKVLGLMLLMSPLKMVNMMIHLEKMNQKLYLILMMKTLIYTFMMRRRGRSRRYCGKQ